MSLQVWKLIQFIKLNCLFIWFISSCFPARCKQFVVCLRPSAARRGAALVSASSSGGLIHQIQEAEGMTISVPQGQSHSASRITAATRQPHWQKQWLDLACCCSLTLCWVTKPFLSVMFPAVFQQILAHDQEEFNNFNRFLSHYSIYYLYYIGVPSAAMLQILNKGGSLSQVAYDPKIEGLWCSCYEWSMSDRDAEFRASKS